MKQKFTLDQMVENIRGILETIQRGIGVVQGKPEQPLISPIAPTPTPDPFIEKGWEKTGPDKYSWPRPSPTPTPTPDYFGVGEEPAYVKPALYEALLGIKDPDIRMALTELSGQESSYGYAGPNITEKEESYGPFHINILAKRKSPKTGLPFTKEEAMDIPYTTQYALDEYIRTGGLGSWNPGSYDFYQYELPKRAKTKKYIKGI